MPADESDRRDGNPADPGDDVILSESTAAPGVRDPAPAGTLTPHDLATPYVLDALETDEREAFEEHLATCELCQARVAELEETALLLPDALVMPPADLPDAFPFLLRDVAHETLPLATAAITPESEGDAGPEPVSPVEAEPAADESGSATTTTGSADDAAAAEPATPGKRQQAQSVAAEEESPPAAEAVARPILTGRPPGRIRPGVRPATVNGEAAGVVPGQRGQLTKPLLAILGLGVVAIGLFLWALLLQGRVGDLQDEIDQQSREIVALRQQANATAYTLSPTTTGPAGASGTFFFSLPDQRGALVARGLPAAPDGRAYQIWFIDDELPAPIAGPTFQVNEDGEALVPLTAEVATFDAVAISLEPAGGSAAPTSQVILQGRLGGAAG